MSFQSEQRFEPAPVCLRVRLISAFSLGGSAISGALIYALLPEARQLPFIVALAVAMPFYIGLLWLLARIRYYSLAGGELRVRRLLYSPRFELEGLQAVERVAEPMKGARKLLGNDGLGAISGRFKSRERGGFRVYLTDTESAVLLRWKDGRAVVLSPEKTQAFVDTLKKRLP